MPLTVLLYGGGGELSPALAIGVEAVSIVAGELLDGALVFFATGFFILQKSD